MKFTAKKTAFLIILSLALYACGEKQNEVLSDNKTVEIPTLDVPPFAKADIQIIPYSCSVDSVAGVPIQQDQSVNANSIIRIEGWAGDVTKANVPPSVVIEFVGPTTYFVPIKLRVERPDVAAARGAALLLSGWDVDVSTSKLPTGRYVMNILQTDGQSSTRCETGRGIVVFK